MAGDEMGRRNTTTEIGYWTPENKSNEWRSLRKNSNKHGYGSLVMPVIHVSKTSH